MSAPLVVNTTDGTVWLRRAATRGGVALYAPAAVCQCPEFVMATEAELAEHGIAGSADVLPMPVARTPLDEAEDELTGARLSLWEEEQENARLRLALASAQRGRRDLRTRLAGMANPPWQLFLALYDGMEPELFTTAEAARAFCDDIAPVDAHGKCWDWTVNEHGVHVQFWTHPDNDQPLSETSGSVTPIVVQGAEPVSELEQLRARVAELEAERHTTNEALADVTVAQRAAEAAAAPGPDGITRRFAPTQALREDGEDVTPQVQKLRALLAGQRAALEDPHDGPLHHTYRVARDLPEMGGTR
ncbi:hypothetical protein [Streptomyces sp. NPDC002573]|uniref:hypothetical protein n=1 Tax=Streptomyces sp. NPDC002573 TaxID=3364651 RepID=UPI0036986EA5